MLFFKYICFYVMTSNDLNCEELDSMISVCTNITMLMTSALSDMLAWVNYATLLLQ